jgi:hypothetical protein
MNQLFESGKLTKDRVRVIKKWFGGLFVFTVEAKRRREENREWFGTVQKGIKMFPEQASHQSRRKQGWISNFENSKGREREREKEADLWWERGWLEKKKESERGKSNTKKGVS